MCTQPQELCDAIVSVWTKTFDFWGFLCKIVASCTLQYITVQIRSQQTSLREKTGNKDTTKQNFHLSFYLPSVAEVYNIHVALLDVPLEVLRTVFFLQVNSED